MKWKVYLDEGTAHIVEADRYVADVGFTRFIDKHGDVEVFNINKVVRIKRIKEDVSTSKEN